MSEIGTERLTASAQEAFERGGWVPRRPAVLAAFARKSEAARLEAAERLEAIVTAPED